jgi:alpha/beta hydrolase family protein
MDGESQGMTTERVIIVDDRLVGILSEGAIFDPPKRKMAVIFLNAGIIHRVGPGRLYVAMARKLSAAGVDACRFDFSGIGDSRENPDGTVSAKKFATDTAKVMDWIERSCEIHEFFLIGICLGAEVALDVCRNDGRVVGMALVNGQFLDPHEAIALSHRVERTARIRFRLKCIASPWEWRDIHLQFLRAFAIAGEYVLEKAAWNVLQRRSRQSSGELACVGKLASFFARPNAKLLLLYAENSSSWDFFTLFLKTKMAIFPNHRWSVKMLPTVDHSLIRPDAQRITIERIYAWMGGNGYLENQNP